MRSKIVIGLVLVRGGESPDIEGRGFVLRGTEIVREGVLRNVWRQF